MIIIKSFTSFEEISTTDCLPQALLNYDREKYKEMLLDAAETVLGMLGFDRTLFGKSKEKKWWMELRRNRMNDVQAEAGVR
jgi:hypothetical protein